MRAIRRIIIIIQKVVRRVKNWPPKKIRCIYASYPMKDKVIGNRDLAIKVHSRSLNVLTFDEMPVASGLRDRGFYISNSHFFGYFKLENFEAACNRIFESVESHYLKTGENIDIIKLLRKKPFLMDEFETIFRAGLDIKILRIVEHYLQLPVAYGGVYIFFAIADGSENGARTWRKDGEDHLMVKAAIYLNDVGDNDGPLEILHLDSTSWSFERLKVFKQQRLINFYSKCKTKFNITSFTGPVGTVFLCDTSKYYHRGKPAIGKSRRALFFNCYASKPLHPYFCPNSPFSIDKMKDVVSTLSEVQKNAALWREDLTGFDRIVTKRKPYLNLQFDRDRDAHF